MSKTIEISKNELENLYINKQCTMTDIAHKLNCSRRTIFNKLSRYNIPKRLPGLNLSLDVIRKQYEKDKMTTQQIADKHGCSRGYIEKQLREMEVQVDNRQRRFLNMYNHVLTESQIQLIKGTILGDASVIKNPYGGCNLSIAHCEKQLNYLLWKKSILKDIIPKDRLEVINKCGTNSFSQGIHYRISTITHEVFKNLRKEFYDKNGVKRVNYFKLTPLSLAAWYYDDGDLHKRSGAIRLHTESFDIISIQKLVDMLKDSFHILSCIREKKITWNNKHRRYNIIYINRKNAHKLIEIVSNYIIPGMEYKLNSSSNPVETQQYAGVSGLKCPDANTPSPDLYIHNNLRDCKLGDGIVRGPRKGRPFGASTRSTRSI